MLAFYRVGVISLSPLPPHPTLFFLCAPLSLNIRFVTMNFVEQNSFSLRFYRRFCSDTQVTKIQHRASLVRRSSSEGGRIQH